MLTLGERVLSQWGCKTPTQQYRAVGNVYLKYSGNSFCKKKSISYSFIVDNPNIIGKFVVFVGQDQVGENYLTQSRIWGPQNTFSKKDALHIRDVLAPPNTILTEIQMVAILIFRKLARPLLLEAPQDLIVCNSPGHQQ